MTSFWGCRNWSRKACVNHTLVRNGRPYAPLNAADAGLPVSWRAAATECIDFLHVSDVHPRSDAAQEGGRERGARTGPAQPKTRLGGGRRPAWIVAWASERPCPNDSP